MLRRFLKNLPAIGCAASLAICLPLCAQSTQPKSGASGASSIDIAHAPAPLFDDPVFHGASDPFVIWNPYKSSWYMYYTQRRASLSGGTGVAWVHGSAIGAATSNDGVHWNYIGVCQGDGGLSNPLTEKGKGPEPGITWWAPCFLSLPGEMHMFVTRVDGVYPDWKGKRQIVHFTSTDGMNWTFADVCALASERVIDPTVYRVNGMWYMVYKNEATGSNTFRSQSKDLREWTNPVQVVTDGSQEAPFVFRWKDRWWLIVDAISKKGLRIYRSDNGIDGWQYVSTVLGTPDGKRPQDQGIGHHPGIVVQSTSGQERALIYYFTQRGRRSVIQLAQLELSNDGKVTCDRNKYTSGGQPATVP
jgi:hypothetical protein